MAIDTIYYDVTLKHNGKVETKRSIQFGYIGNRGLYKLRVRVDDELDGCTVRIYWHPPADTDAPQSSLVVNGEATVPAIITSVSGSGQMVFEGVIDDQVITTANLPYRVAVNAGIVEGSAPEPGFTAWQQYINAVSEDAESAAKSAKSAEVNANTAELSATSAAEANLNAKASAAAASESATASESSAQKSSTSAESATESANTAKSSASEAAAFAEEASKSATALDEAVQKAAESATEAAKSLQDLKYGIANGDFDGEDGYSPTIEVADTENGHIVAITDKDGTKSFEVLNGKDDTELKDEINANTAARHTHDNKDILDGITTDKIAEWDNKSDFSGSPFIIFSGKYDENQLIGINYETNVYDLALGDNTTFSNIKEAYNTDDSKIVLFTDGVDIYPITDYYFTDDEAERDQEYVEFSKGVVTGAEEFSGAILLTGKITSFYIDDMGNQGAAVSSLNQQSGYGTIANDEYAYNKTLRYVSSNAIQVGYRAFRSCTALKSVVLNKVNKLGVGVFAYDTALTYVELPSVTSIGTEGSGSGDNGTFEGCSALTNIVAPNLTTILGRAFQYCTALTSVEFPELTTFKAHFAFSNCTALTSVIFPKLTNITYGTFEDCTALTYVELPLVTKIEDRAFISCKALETVELPSVTSLGDMAFHLCTSLKKVDLGAITSIGKTSFFNYVCNEVFETLIIRTSSVCSISSGAFDYFPSTMSIYVPSSLVDSYKADSVWATYSDRIKAIEDYPDITG